MKDPAMNPTPMLWRVRLAASALLLAGGQALAVTEIRLVPKNDTRVPADDFHILVSNTGGGPVGASRLTRRAVNSVAGLPTAGWRNSPGAGMNTATTADFDKGVGAAVAVGAKGDFWVQNNTNYMKILLAYWTFAGAPILDPNGQIHRTELYDHMTDYSFNVSGSGSIFFDPGSTADAQHYAHLLVRTGVAVAELQRLADPDQTSALSFGDVDALAGATLFRDPLGGTFTGMQSYAGPALAADTGAFIYIDDGLGGLVFAWSDGVGAVPEPGSFGLLGAGLLSVAALWRRGRPRPA
jgi:hypothetical protein